MVTVTATDSVAVPPDPLQDNEYDDVEVGATDWMPDVARVPDHAPNAVQVDALLDDQFRLDDCPTVIDCGDAEIETVGAPSGGGGVVTVPNVKFFGDPGSGVDFVPSFMSMP